MLVVEAEHHKLQEHQEQVVLVVVEQEAPLEEMQVQQVHQIREEEVVRLVMDLQVILLEVPAAKV
jgi:hypothetical protein